MRHTSATIPSALPEPVTIGDHLTRAGRQRGDAAAVIDHGMPHGWRALDAASDQLACGLLGLKLQRGDRIGIIGLNQVDWLLLFYAAAKIGVAVVGLSLRDRDTALEAMLGDSQAKVVFTPQQHDGCDCIALLQRLGPRLPALRHVIAFDGSGLNSLAALAATPLEAGRLSAVRRRVQADDVAMVLDSAGTTGRPQGVALTHRSLLAAAAAQARHTRVNTQDVLHLANPLHQVGGITCGVLTHLVGGGTVVLVPDCTADRMTALMTQHRPTLLAGPPALLAQLLMHARIDAVDLSAVRMVVVHGAPVDAALRQRMAGRLPQATLMRLYGQAETSGAIVMTAWDDGGTGLPGTIGLPLAGARVRVVGPRGEPVPPGTVGTLCFQGAGVVPGDISAAAGQALGLDRWLQTNDLGAVDARGVITLTGRRQDIALQGGVPVQPAVAAAQRQRQPAMGRAAGFGMPELVPGGLAQAVNRL